MADREGEPGALPDILSLSPATFRDLLEDMSGEALAFTEAHHHWELREDESLLLLADFALAPSCGSEASCSHPEARGEARSLQELQLQLQFFLSRADDLHDCLESGKSHLDREALAAAVSSLLHTCKPYFNLLESTGRSSVSQRPAEFCSKLLDFSQQLSDRLEQLLLAYASCDLISVDEARPDSVSHFCVGQSRLGQTRLTAFRYCKPTPFLSRVDTGVYKRMRWNVDRLREDGCEEEETQTEFYFLCYEDIPNTHADPDAESQDTSDGSMLRMWSIGQWVQVDPEPATEDIDDWILCEVPEASYNRLLYLGPDEPSGCTATSYLLQLLLPGHTD
ncbi:UPF0575 protein C19orf67 homolog [Fundulus heteroclitus]|uniref:UPF0575 protein C19orf67 homolog n=1 Tax=Fundulus heteroclitus TaxID=8078 RepID=UPI00165ACEF5|nr:UPF0575 protein C19orf67 homolog [Fundulus heteroclitus]XP_035992679.1 UPF0575 protein C19orf67 homolog [Fundulus heteroclitus]